MSSSSNSSSAPAEAGRPSTFKAFQHRNFRLLWISLVVSNVGTWLQAVAQGWLIHDLTGKYLDLGLLGLARAIPLLAFSLFGGTIADRVDKRKLLYWTQALSALFALVQAALTQFHLVQVWHIWVLGFLSSLVLAFDQPTRQAMLPSLVPREDLLNAIALMSVAFNGAAVFGPALAGLVVPYLGYAWSFYLNGFSFAAVILAVYWLDLPKHKSPAARPSVMKDVLEGLRFVTENQVIFTLTVLAAAMGFLAAPYSQMLPGYRQILNINEQALGILTSAPGLGTLMGGFLVARYSYVAAKGKLVLAAAAAVVLTLAAFSWSKTYHLSILILVLVGLAMTVFTSMVQTLLQQNTDDRRRGRVMSMYTITIIGLSPLGALPLGALSDAIGAPRAILAVALLVGVVTIFLARRIQGLE